MTIWCPDLPADAEPLHRAIADALAADVAVGRLPPGTRLPPQRDLAHRLGVAVGTVSRAYAEARRRGLVTGEVGRGTYVRPPDPSPTGGFAQVVPPRRDALNLTMVTPAPEGLGTMLGETLQSLGREGLPTNLAAYGPVAGHARHREAAAELVRALGVPADAGQVVIANGAQNAVAISLMATLRPGERVAAEALTYPGLKALAAPMALRLEAVEMDEGGLDPDALDACCRTGGVRVLYTMPGLQNPTGITQTTARREAIVAVARRHDLLLIEDDVYGFLVPGPPRLATLAPERTLHVTSVSKYLPPALRIGMLTAPPALLPRVEAALRALSWMASPLLAEVVARMVANGDAQAAMDRQCEEAVARIGLVRARLGDVAPAEGSSMHAWLPLPAPWRWSDFVDAALARGVAVVGADAFAVGRDRVPHAVRLGLGTGSRTELAAGLDVLADLLEGDPQPAYAVV